MIASAPIGIVLYCPRCGAQHIDAPEPEKGWSNPPHRSHLCRTCDFTWRPADVPTNGVVAAQTRGANDWPLGPAGAAPVAADLALLRVERADIVRVLRYIIDGDWDDKSNLADVIEKYLTPRGSERETVTVRSPARRMPDRVVVLLAHGSAAILHMEAAEPIWDYLESVNSPIPLERGEPLDVERWGIDRPPVYTLDGLYSARIELYGDSGGLEGPPESYARLSNLKPLTAEEWAHYRSGTDWVFEEADSDTSPARAICCPTCGLVATSYGGGPPASNPRAAACFRCGVDWSIEQQHEALIRSAWTAGLGPTNEEINALTQRVTRQRTALEAKP